MFMIHDTKLAGKQNSREMKYQNGNETAAQSFFVAITSFKIRFLSAIRLIYLIWTNAPVSFALFNGRIVVAGCELTTDEKIDKMCRDN